MKVTQFFMGMGPRLWSFQRNGVEYGVRALPIGAFVRIVGMNNLDETDPEDEPVTYRSKSYPKRLLVITAGSMMPMVIAIVLLFGVYSVAGKNSATGEVAFVGIEVGGPAEKAGVLLDDIVVSNDGVAVTSAEQFVGLVHQHKPGDIADIEVLRAGTTLTVPVKLGTNPNPGSEGVAYLGVSSADKSAFQNIPLAEAFTSSFTDLGSAAWQSAKGVVTVMNPANIISHLTGANTDQSTQAIAKAVKLQPATADSRTDKGLVIVRIQSGMLVQVEHSVELSNTGCIGVLDLRGMDPSVVGVTGELLAVPAQRRCVP
jgi:membrane-associated protease RseP (regulator of RpoE activity)